MAASSSSTTTTDCGGDQSVQERNREGGGLMTRFYGLGRALADSLSIVGDADNDMTASSKFERGAKDSRRGDKDSEKEEIRRQLVSFYNAYNPDKVSEVDNILDIFAGREKLMFEALKKKYGVTDKEFRNIVVAAEKDMEVVSAPALAEDDSTEDARKRRTPPEIEIYVVPVGATLMGIALQRNCSVGVLRRLNPEIKYQLTISEGQRLKVPKMASKIDEAVKKSEESNCAPCSVSASDGAGADIVRTESTPGQKEGEDVDESSANQVPRTVHLPVEFCAVGVNIYGSLLVAPDFIMFEPDAKDATVRNHGVLTYQFCIDIRDVIRVGVVSYMPRRADGDEEEDADDGVQLDPTTTTTTEHTHSSKIEDCAAAAKSMEDNERKKEIDVDGNESTRSQRSCRPFGGSYLQVFWRRKRRKYSTDVKTRPENKSSLLRRNSSDFERHVLFQTPRAAITDLVSAIQDAIASKKRVSRRSGAINFTSDGGGMLRATTLDDLFAAIERNRGVLLNIDRDPKVLSVDPTDFDDENASNKSDAVLPRKEKIEIQRVRSCELLSLKARLVEKSELLKDSVCVAVIDNELPPSIRGETWGLRYSLVRDGQSFSTFLSSVARCGPSIVVVQSEHGDIFGGYASQSWRVRRRGFFGTGECFLFRIATKGERDFATWKWTGANDDFMMCSNESIAMGCGVDGKFGFHLGEDFLRGNSAPCATFGNEQLASAYDFEVVAVEVWGLDDG